MRLCVRFIVLVFVLAAAGPAAAGDLYYCPMHPHYHSDKPGNCPICGMTLVKKEEASVQDTAAAVPGHQPVALGPRSLEQTGVRTAVVARRMLMKTVRAPGYTSTIHELFQLQDEYIQAYTDYVTTFRNYKRFEHKSRNLEPHRKLQLQMHAVEDRLLQLGLSPAQIEHLQNVSWTTPWEQPELLFFKDSLDYYWVVARVFEDDLPFVKTGGEVEVDIPANGDQAVGIIRSVGGVLDPQTRTADVLIALKGYTGELRGNMFVHVSISEHRGEALVVPYTAVMDTGRRKIVYVETAPGRFEPREIRAGRAGDLGWEVRTGLQGGEKVAVEGNFLLDSESRFQAAALGGGHD